MNIVFEFIKQLFCKHKYMEYNNIGRVGGEYIERWLLCKKCGHHKWITIYKFEDLNKNDTEDNSKQLY